MTKMPKIQPLERWRPYYYIGQNGHSTHINMLPDLGVAAYQILLSVSKSKVDLTASQIALLAHAYRTVAIETTVLLVNLMTR